MSTDPNEENTTLAPDDAFSVLGNETRMEILHSLGEADGPLSFSDLRDRVGMRDSGQFNYHLGQLVGHFLEETHDGYALRQAGRRVIEAVLSGAVTEAPVVERTQIDQPCPLCGTPLELGYRQERVEMYCSECGGTRRGTSDTVSDWAAPSAELLGYVYLPPAGVRDRSPSELQRAAGIWTVADAHKAARGVCPRCSAILDHSVQVCEEHDTTGGRCDHCDQRFGITVESTCTNCIFDLEVPAGAYLQTKREVTVFMIDNRMDPFHHGGFHLHGLEETLISTDPFEARFTFTADDESLSLTVNEDLTVIDGRRRDSPTGVDE